MDIGSITAAVQSLKAAGDIATGLLRLHTAAEIQPKIAELNRQIIDAQHQVFAANAAQTELLKQIQELERQIGRMQDWEAQKQRYGLAAPFAGCMVYALKKEKCEGEPPHYLCVACYQKGEKSILQGMEIPGGGRGAVYLCSRKECGSQAETRWCNVTPPQYLEDIKPE